MKTNIAYVEKQNSDFTSIKILDEPYAGIIYTYGKVSVSEPDGENGNATLTFDYKVEEVPPIYGKSEKEIEEDKEFSNFIGDILIEIFEDSVNNEESADDNPSDNNE
jgi:hypothetical protein